ncbi:hypothetical protein ScalyP_jg9345 [Parmales sp. scaly parma]|nr:hypothetical protein ScalyP_jg9345 [Parmales sp. scaly parma]
MKFTAAAALLSVANAATIWPLPQTFTTTSEGANLVLTNKFAFVDTSGAVYDSPATKRYLAQMFPHNVDASSGDALKIEVTIDNEDEDLQLGADESYSLDIPTDGSSIKIKSKTQFGFYHALESLSQLVEFDFDEETYFVAETPVAVVDAPRFQHRGLLIDSSRHFEPVSTIKRVIDSLTFAKLNVLHWHLVDSQSFPFDSPSFPLLGKEGAYSNEERYSPNDVKEVVAYAKARGVRVMVEIDTPGHAAAWCKGYPEICPDAANGCFEPLNPMEDQTFDLIEGLFGDLTGGARGEGLFPENLMHLGGDEVNTDCWKNTPKIADWMEKQGMNEDDTYAFFINKVQKIAKDQGRDVVGWEEIWNHFGTDLDPSTIIHQWIPGSHVGGNVTAAGYRLIWSTDDKWYLDGLANTFTSMYESDPTEGIADENVHLLLGGEGCMWGETADTSDIMQTIWPRMGAIAERLWSDPAQATTAEVALPRYSEFRCMMNRRGYAAAPSLNDDARSAPPGPGGCLTQRL